MANLDPEQLLASIKIPPRPTVLLQVMEEQRKEYPDMNKIASFIGTDVSLSAAVMKTVNSPAYGLSRKVTSIKETVNLLGSKTISSLVMGLSARGAIPSPGIEKFWDAATQTALLAASIGPRYAQLDRETAHMYGLFHDCGVPLMLARFKDYPQTMTTVAADGHTSFSQIEDKIHNTNHAVVGSLLAANWQLPENIRQAILLHHDPKVFKSEEHSLEVQKLVAIGHIAEFLVGEITQMPVESDANYFISMALDFLVLQNDDLDELRQSAREILEHL